MNVVGRLIVDKSGKILKTRRR